VPVQRCTLPLPVPLFPYGPYDLYRASVPLQRCTLPLPVTLLPLRTARPVQNISPCTTVHFNFTYTSTPPMDRTACTEPQCLYNGAFYLYLYLYSPYGPYGLYRTSVPVQRCTLTLPIPLLHLWTVRPEQSLSASTTVHFTFSYTSTPLWTVQPVQSLIACRTVHFNFTYTSTHTLWTVRPVQSLSACTTLHFPLYI